MTVKQIYWSITKKKPRNHDIQENEQHKHHRKYINVTIHNGKNINFKKLQLLLHKEIIQSKRL